MIPDPSSFYLANEDIAREFRSLLDSGALTPLLARLNEAGLTLRIESVREQQGLRELLGILDPAAQSNSSSRSLPMHIPGADSLLAPGRIWDPAATLCARSRFEISFRDGRREEVYMPDHICPECFNSRGNIIDDCARRCTVCAFSW